MVFDPSRPPAARTALDVAIWFLDRARTDDSHLPFQKLHRLLYLAQSLFAARTGGLLMPAIFLAEEVGPTRAESAASAGRRQTEGHHRRDADRAGAGISRVGLGTLCPYAGRSAERSGGEKSRHIATPHVAM